MTCITKIMVVVSVLITVPDVAKRGRRVFMDYGVREFQLTTVNESCEWKYF